jgi:hypothetical protein
LAFAGNCKQNPDYMMKTCGWHCDEGKGDEL